MYKGQYEDEFHVYSSKNLEQIMRLFCSYTIQPKFTKYFDERIFFHNIENDTELEILGRKVTFFNICAKKMEQHGIRVELKNGKTLVCLGDETYDPRCESYVKGADWLLSEAFCLYADRERFKPYEKFHSTVKDVCELAQCFNIPNLVIWHTEDSHLENRRMLYTGEGSAYYDGNLYIPDDLDVIRL